MYKRQRLECQAVQHGVDHVQRHLARGAGRAGVGKGHGGAKGLAAQAAHPAPVSYTHLDVYKRQNEGSLEKGLAAYKEAGVDAHGYVADEMCIRDRL